MDETADISGIEQVSICARYVNRETCTLQVLQFVPNTDLTGKGLAALILDNLKHFGIETVSERTRLRWSGDGVQCHIKQSHPLAVYIHCSVHSLNLAVSSSCGIQSIRNCLGTVGKL